MAIYHLKMTGQQLEALLQADKSLEKEGKFADAKATGDKIKALEEIGDELTSQEELLEEIALAIDSKQ